MFAGLFSTHNDEDEDDDAETPVSSDDEPRDTSASTSSGGIAGVFDFWNVAAAVSNTVKARADELLQGVAATNWRSELMAFSREVGDESATLQAKAEEGLEGVMEGLEKVLPDQEDLSSSANTVFSPDGTLIDLGPRPATAVQAPVLNLDDVGGSLSRFGKSLFVGTRELIEQVRDAVESEIAVAAKDTKRGGRAASKASTAAKVAAAPTKRYSRFESEVASLQMDPGTYCDEPEDSGDYATWRAGFALADMAGDISATMAANSFMSELQTSIVPTIVEHDDFWARYFYRYHKLVAKEESRKQLLQLAARAQNLEEEEDDEGWGDDEDLTDALAAAEAAAAESAAADSDAAALLPEPSSQSAAVAPPHTEDDILAAAHVEEEAGEVQRSDEAGGVDMQEELSSIDIVIAPTAAAVEQDASREDEPECCKGVEGVETASDGDGSGSSGVGKEEWCDVGAETAHSARGSEDTEGGSSGVHVFASEEAAAVTGINAGGSVAASQGATSSAGREPGASAIHLASLLQTSFLQQKQAAESSSEGEPSSPRHTPTSPIQSPHSPAPTVHSAPAVSEESAPTSSHAFSPEAISLPTAAAVSATSSLLSSPGPASPVKAVASSSTSTTSAASPAVAAALQSKRAVAGPGEEALDEDWGNWD